MEIHAEQLILDRVISTCRQVELMSAHLQTLYAESAQVNHAAKRQFPPFRPRNKYETLASFGKCGKKHPPIVRQQLMYTICGLYHQIFTHQDSLL